MCAYELASSRTILRKTFSNYRSYYDTPKTLVLHLVSSPELYSKHNVGSLKEISRPLRTIWTVCLAIDWWLANLQLSADLTLFNFDLEIILKIHIFTICMVLF